jgi:hypothetical protein
MTPTTVSTTTITTRPPGVPDIVCGVSAQLGAATCCLIGNNIRLYFS